MLAHHPSLWLRHGDLSDTANKYRALTAAPSLATDGIPVPPNRRDELATLDLTSAAAGGAAHSFSVVIWGYKPAVGIYKADGSLEDISGSSAAGWSNLGQIDIAASGTQARSGHQLRGISGYTRLYAQAINAVGSPDIWADFGLSLHETE